MLQFSGENKESPADALKRILGDAVPVMQFSVKTPSGDPPSKTTADDDESKALSEANAKLGGKWKGGA